ncbi:MAG TPA: hypothetical protein V6C84_19520 [Coleofasciculaceae cyanobacterium]
MAEIAALIGSAFCLKVERFSLLDWKQSTAHSYATLGFWQDIYQ